MISTALKPVKVYSDFSISLLFAYQRRENFNYGPPVHFDSLILRLVLRLVHGYVLLRGDKARHNKENLVGRISTTLKSRSHFKLYNFIILVSLIFFSSENNCPVVTILISLISQVFAKNLIPCGDDLMQHKLYLTYEIVFVQLVQVNKVVDII